MDTGQVASSSAELSNLKELVGPNPTLLNPPLLPDLDQSKKLFWSCCFNFQPKAYFGTIIEINITQGLSILPSEFTSILEDLETFMKMAVISSLDSDHKDDLVQKFLSLSSGEDNGI